MTICIVDDVLENAQYAERVLSGYETVSFTDPNTALEHCIHQQFDILLVDQKMPDMTGVELVKAVRANTQDFLAIVLSAYTDSEDLIDAVNSNLVHKYIVKPISPNALLQHIHRACERLELMRTNNSLQEQLRVQNRILIEENRLLKAGSQPIFDVFTGSDSGMNRVKELTQLYAAGTQPILVTGETGTGKELLARVIHAFSPRRDRSFLPVNCAAFQDGLLESELFGYEKGAFTGAEKTKKGLVELADGGVLFLDEIGELPLALQPKLLRVLQFGTYIPLGGTRERTVDLRLISATNKNLQREVQRGTFREDLLHRINAFQIHLPPLRQRASDILPILERIAEARSVYLPDFTPQARKLLLSHRYPGNVRELQNVLERILALSRHARRPIADEEIVRGALFPAGEGEGEGEGDGQPESAAEEERRADVVGRTHQNMLKSILEVHPDESIDLSNRVAMIQQTIIAEVYEQERGNITRTADRVGMSRPGVRAKLREFGLLDG